MSFIMAILKINHVPKNGQKFCLPGWTSVAEFAAIAANVVVRRRQMWGVYNHAPVHPGFVQDVTGLDSIGAKDFVNAALACGECHSIREVLISKPLAG